MIILKVSNNFSGLGASYPLWDVHVSGIRKPNVVYLTLFSGGVGRTGVFIALSNLIERAKSENVVDVYQTVKRMRLQRTAMVQTKVCNLF